MTWSWPSNLDGTPLLDRASVRPAVPFGRLHERYRIIKVEGRAGPIFGRRTAKWFERIFLLVQRKRVLFHRLAMPIIVLIMQHLEAPLNSSAIPKGGYWHSVLIYGILWTGCVKSLVSISSLLYFAWLKVVASDRSKTDVIRICNKNHQPRDM